MTQEETFYLLKHVELDGQLRSIVLQNENGPCPLVALSNVLLLRGSMTIHQDYSQVPASALLQMITDLLMRTNPPHADPGLRENQQRLMSDAMQALPLLQYGMTVNVRFGSTSSFEYTPEFAVFDLLRVNIYHGWLVDPEDAVTMSVLGGKSYNQVTEKIIAMQDLPTEPPVMVPDIAASLAPAAPEQTEAVPPQLATLEITTSETTASSPEVTLAISVTEVSATTVAAELAAASAEPTAESVSVGAAPTAVTDAAVAQREAQATAQREAVARWEQVRREGKIAQDFLASSASQLTHFGLYQLHQTVQENELCVFFRNNHFATMIKRAGIIFLLATDVGFGSIKDIVWEQQAQVEGDNPFVDGQFRLYQARDSPGRGTQQPQQHQPAPQAQQQILLPAAAVPQQVGLPPDQRLPLAQQPSAAARRGNEQRRWEQSRQQQQAEIQSLRANQHQQYQQSQPTSGATSPTVESDAQMAMRLQREEDARAAGIQQHQRQHAAQKKKKDDDCRLL
eukprot:TRINITY_DN8628_c0_g1_i1.p1 TRINITY_DN8628_c0_g1~~TRINITY_DN8628_c0_g1_i1.p1  ORF type:complete len:510 (-),score=124.91 TRINITY_DN8628_c0_g1_i1:21-1550(-)